MKTIAVRIKGISALLVNRFKEQSEVPVKMKCSNKKDYGTPRFQAESSAYLDPDGTCWVPGTWIKGALTTVSSDYKLPSSRKSVKSVIGGAVLCTEEKIYFDEGYTKSQIEVDSRPCVVQRARIMRHRARFEEWSLSFHLEVEDSILGTAEVHQMLGDSGKRAGIGDFRAAKGGPFGRFQIVSWKEVKDKIVKAKKKRKA